MLMNFKLANILINFLYNINEIFVKKFNIFVIPNFYQIFIYIDQKTYLKMITKVFYRLKKYFFFINLKTV